MIRKIVIIIVCIWVLLLAKSYRDALRIQRNEWLVRDAYYGDLLSVKTDVERGADLSFEFYFSDEEREYAGAVFNALHAAASSGNEDVINYLLEQGMDIDALTPNGWTPLFIATRDGQSEAAKLLIFRGAKLNTQSNLGATALLMAVTQKYPSEQAQLDLISYLLARGADPNLADRNGHTALYYATALKNKKIIALLKKHGAKLTPPAKKEQKSPAPTEQGKK